MEVRKAIESDFTNKQVPSFLLLTSGMRSLFVVGPAGPSSTSSGFTEGMNISL